MVSGSNMENNKFVAAAEVPQINLDSKGLKMVMANITIAI